MKALQLCALVMASLLSASCATRSVPPTIPIKPTPCKIDPWPAPPELTSPDTPCPDDAVCLDVQSVVGLGIWVRQVTRVHEDLQHCPQVVEDASMYNALGEFMNGLGSGSASLH